MSLEAQAKLLRVLEDGLVDRVGGTHPVPIDVRVMAATNSDLMAAVNEGRFRSDLYYRLHVFPIVVPPLRARRKGVPREAEASCAGTERPFYGTVDALCLARQRARIANVVERAVILTRSPVIDRATVLATSAELQNPSPNLTEMERRHIVRVLETRTGVFMDHKEPHLSST